MRQAKLEARVLGKPLVQAGIERQSGETVELRADQIARLEPEGYFVLSVEARRQRKSTGGEGAAK